MKITKTAAIIGIAVAGTLLFGVGGCAYVVGAYNNANKLKNDYEAKEKANEASFDNMWKKIQQVAQVPNEKKEAFKEIIAAYSNGRGPNGGTVLSSVREAVPNVDLNVYDQLMNIIVGSRNTWTTNQTELVSIANEYNNAVTRLPNSLFLGAFGFQKITPKIISSERTESAFKTGKDDDVSLFNKKAEK